MPGGALLHFHGMRIAMDTTMRHTIETYGQLHLMLKMLPALKNVNSQERDAISDAIQRAIERLEGILEGGE